MDYHTNTNGRINLLSHDKNNTLFKLKDSIPIQNKKNRF